MRRGVAAAGRTLIAAGVLVLLFVAYQLWGTGLAEARYQRRLTRQFEQSLAAGALPAATATSTTAAGGAPTTGPPTTAPLAPPAPPAGDAVAIIKIPDIGVEKAVIEGVTLGFLKRGPGHYPGTPLPGQSGNAAIAGHRTTYGAPFGRLDDLETGDVILVTTRQGRFRYEVTGKQVVRPDDTSVLGATEDNRLTLTTCHPRYSAARRLVVVAELTGEAAEPAPPPVVEDGPAAPGAPSGTVPTTAPRSLAGAEGESGLSGGGAGNGPAVAWGLAAAAVWALTWLAGRRWRRWPAYLAGTPVFLVVLFVFYENLNRLLPGNY